MTILILKLCKTQAFHLTVLVSVQSRPGSSFMTNPFCRMRMYCMHALFTTLVYPGVWHLALPDQRLCCPSSCFEFLFQSNLVRFMIVSLASLRYLLHFWTLFNQSQPPRGRGAAFEVAPAAVSENPKCVQPPLNPRGTLPVPLSQQI